MEGSISRESFETNQGSQEGYGVVSERKAQKYGAFTHSVCGQDPLQIRMAEFANNFPAPEEFEMLLQSNLEEWGQDSDKPKDDFWLNKPA